MRLLHTSDWHLGQTFHGHERRYEHDCFLNWLLDTLSTEQADALLIAGDLFDNANPAADTQKQLYHFLTAAKRRLPDLDIVMIAGNHDSAGRLEAPTPLFTAFDVTAIGHTTRDAHRNLELDRLLVPLRKGGHTIAAWCLAVPFLRPGDVPRVASESGDPYSEGVQLLYQQVLTKALTRRSHDQAIVALGHCHMSGGQLSEYSERRLVIGGIEALPVSMFDPAIAYVALGHLHRAQSVGGQARVRYAGSPLAMSFTEIHYHHQVIRVDLEGDALVAATPIPIPRFVELLRIPDQPATIAEVLDALAQLSLPDRPFEAQPYLEVRVQLNAPEPGLRARIEAALAGKPVRLARIETSYGPTERRETTDSPQSLDELDRLQPADIFSTLHWRKYGTAPSADLLKAFRELLLTPDSKSDS